MPADAQRGSSSIRKKTGKRRKKKSKTTASSKASSREKKLARSKKKRRRHDTPSSSHTSSSSPSDYSSDRGRHEKRLRRQRSPSPDLGSPSRRKKKPARGRSKKKGRSRRGREASVSSSSDSYSSRSRSRSCSTCSGRSSSPEDRRTHRDGRGARKLRKKGSDGRSKGGKSEPRGRIKRRRSGRRHRSSSSEFTGSSRSGHSSRSYSHGSEERFAGKSGSCGRSQYAVASAKGPKELGSRDGSYKDDSREEIIQDYADFAPSWSNDGCEDTTKRERRGTPVEKVDGDASTERKDSPGANARPIDNVTEGETRQQGRKGSLLHDSQRDEPPRLRSVVVVPARSPEADDLELLLRQKALENLKKFKCASSSKVDATGNSKHALTRNQKGESEESDVENQEEKHVAMAEKNKSPNAMEIDQHAQAQNRGSSVTNFSTKIATLPTPREQSNGSQVGREQSNGGQVCNHPDTNVTLMPVTIRSSTSSIDNHYKSQSAPNQLLKEQDDSDKNLLKPPSVTNKAPDSAKTVSYVNKNAGNNSVASASGSSTILDPKPGLHITSEHSDQAKTDPELEKKTMTVMRGGEVLQVSYKVYIPKKAPALTRRQLQR